MDVPAPQRPPQGRVVVGISGYDYPHWRGRFYPHALARHAWFDLAARTFSTIELNGTFYSLKRPEHFQRWHDGVDDDFVFAIKGSRFVTHMKQLKDVEVALANFYASGLLLLGRKTGPFLWQLPDRVKLNPERLERFFQLLPRSSKQAAALALRHDERVADRAVVEAAVDVPYRHCLEPRHPSFFTEEARALLRAYDVSFVIADSAGVFPMAVNPVASFVYVRLHGSRELYNSGYTPDEIAAWAADVRAFRDDGKDVYVYFDNDGLGHAPYDALSLAAAVRGDTTPTPTLAPEPNAAPTHDELEAQKKWRKAEQQKKKKSPPPPPQTHNQG